MVEAMGMASPWVVWGVSGPLAMAYVYYGVMKLPRGMVRLVASMPLMVFYIRTGYEFGTVFERGIYSFFFIWLTSFKVALLCWDQGPVADPWAIASFPRFLAVMNLSLQIKRQKFAERFKKASVGRVKPSKHTKDSLNGASHVVVAPQENETSSTTRHRNGHLEMSSDNGCTAEDDGDGGSRKGVGWMALLKAVEASQETPLVVLRLLFKFVFLGVIVYSYKYRDLMHVGVLALVYSFDIYVACSLIFEGIAAVVSPLMGIELEPAFDKPFVAHSLADFWGKRWNLLVSNLLRVSIYDPLLRILLWSQADLHKSKATLGLQEHSQEAATISAPPNYAFNKLPQLPRSVATFACFLASGLMHELIFYNMTRSKPTWAVTFFFILNGAATILEGALRQNTKLRLPKVVSIPLTLSFILVTAIWYFYPPLEDSGAVEDSIAEFTYFFESLHKLVVRS
ncbi:hypothetical protein KC19_1G037700 [Ceratodon purpureus]|uniref:Wax synthase domain-containing protein n=1 Tax=Ceratodon purpureus TaxID=3225 RepID=A0A8T0J368_CERPU|nr:hypothetical protein KC19_1G037700 [Ceratodon purpureus]